MANAQLEAGRERLRVVLDPIPVVMKAELIEKNTFAKWKTSDGDMGGFITTSLSGKSLVDVGFFASYTPGDSSGDPLAILAIDLSSIDTASFT